eukprot:ctg_1455.g287
MTRSGASGPRPWTTLATRSAPWLLAVVCWLSSADPAAATSFVMMDATTAAHLRAATTTAAAAVSGTDTEAVLQMQLRSAIDDAQACRDAFGALRPVLRAAHDAASTISPRANATDDGVSVRAATSAVDQFRLSLRQPPVSDTRKRFFKLTNLLRRVLEKKPPTSEQKTIETNYQSVKMALDQLDALALRASRTRGADFSVRVAELQSEPFERVLQTMDWALELAKHLLD